MAGRFREMFRIDRQATGKKCKSILTDLYASVNARVSKGQRLVMRL